MSCERSIFSLSLSLSGLALARPGLRRLESLERSQRAYPGRHRVTLARAELASAWLAAQHVACRIFSHTRFCRLASFLAQSAARCLPKNANYAKWTIAHTSELVQSVCSRALLGLFAVRTRPQRPKGESTLSPLFGVTLRERKKRCLSSTLPTCCLPPP